MLSGSGVTKIMIELNASRKMTLQGKEFLVVSYISSDMLQWFGNY